MTVTLLQTDILWGERAANLAQARKAILQAPGSDLYVLPEMFATGFNVSPQDIAEPAADGPTLRWMQQTARETGAALAGSVAVRDKETYRNRLYFVRPDGTFHFYDKHHLFTHGGEARHYTAGQERTVVEWRGVRFLLLVCYDLRFPIWSRNTSPTGAAEPFDCILYVASWPTSRIHVWDTLLRARALENQCYVCGINRTGTDPFALYPGHTLLVDPYGRATMCQPDAPGTLTAHIDLPLLQAFRQRFPVLADRD